MREIVEPDPLRVRQPAGADEYQAVDLVDPRPHSLFVDSKEFPVSESILAKSREHEHRLIDRVRSGDSASSRELIDLHKDRLFSFIWRMIHDHHEAEDVCQEAFLKAFASLDSFRSEFRFSTWLFTIGYRVCLNRLRRKQEVVGDLDVTPIEDSHDNEPFVLESEDASRLRDIVWSAVEELSPPQRATVLLFYRHEMGCHEIAQVLELPVATVKSHLHRARGRLKDMLAPLDENNLETYRNRIASVG